MQKVLLVFGTNTELIAKEVQTLFSNAEAYKKISPENNPYTGGRACQKIINFLRESDALTY